MKRSLDPFGYRQLSADVQDATDAWMRLHGAEKDDTYLIETSGSHATFYQYARDEHGKPFVKNGEMVRRPPLSVALKAPVPW